MKKGFFGYGRCPNCDAFLKEKDLEKNTCWSCKGEINQKENDNSNDNQSKHYSIKLILNNIISSIDINNNTYNKELLLEPLQIVGELILKNKKGRGDLTISQEINFQRLRLLTNLVEEFTIYYAATIVAEDIFQQKSILDNIKDDILELLNEEKKEYEYHKKNILDSK